jgi:preprotein translocase subunit SecA
MLNGIIKKIFGDKSKRDLTELSPIVDLTNDAHQQLLNLSDDQLRQKNS